MFGMTSLNLLSISFLLTSGDGLEAQEINVAPGSVEKTADRGVVTR